MVLRLQSAAYLGCKLVPIGTVNNKAATAAGSSFSQQLVYPWSLSANTDWMEGFYSDIE
jgi:hypothetical protein